MTDAVQPRRRRKLDLSVQILIGLALGVLCGLFFGEICAFLEPVGDVYVGLLQMTVLPYIMIALVAGIGRLSLGDSKRLMWTGLKVLLVLWLTGAVVIVAGSLALPTWDVGSFFSAADFEPAAETNLLQLFVPYNVFESMASTFVPAVVLFCLVIGVALIGIEKKAAFIDVLDVLAEALQRVNKSMVKLAPYGTFAIAGAAAGTMQVGDLARLQAYILIYTIGVLLLTFLVLPLLITSVTPFTYREVFRASKTALVTAFATGKVIVVLPLLVSEVQQLFRKHFEKEEQAESVDRTVETVFPIGYPFPQLGKLVALVFIPFTAWFVGKPLGLVDYPSLLGAGYLSYFGGPVVATPFLLDMYQLPSDMFKLFLASGVYTSRVGDLLGTVHLIALTILTTAALHGLLKIRWVPLLRGLAISVGVGAVLLVAVRVHLGASFKDMFAKDKVLSEMALSIPDAYRVKATVVEAGPNPVPLDEGQGVLDRVKARGVLRIGVDRDRLPFAYENVRGELVGLDVELAHLLAKDLGVDLVIVPFRTETLAEQMHVDHFDLAVGGICVTPERAEEMSLSQPYLELTLALLVKDHQADEFRTLSDLRSREGLRVGVADPTLGRPVRRSLPDAELVTLPDAATFFGGQGPEVDVVIVTAEIGAAYTIRYPEYSVVNPFPQRVTMAAAFPLASGDTAFKEYVDNWLEFNRRLGWIDRLYDRWILGQEDEDRPPRWSIIRDVLGWIE